MVGTGDNENTFFWSILTVTTIVDIDIFSWEHEHETWKQKLLSMS